eukprot:scaffold571_cov34-Cyclotella_meneghiniana.AAC.6
MSCGGACHLEWMVKNGRNVLSDATPSGINESIPTHWSCWNGEHTIRNSECLYVIEAARPGGVVCLLPAEWQIHWNGREYRGSVGGNNTQEQEMLYFLRISRWHVVLEKNTDRSLYGIFDAYRHR